MRAGSFLLLLAIATHVSGQFSPGKWTTDTSRRSIELDELALGGPGKDGIPAIHDPRFVSVEDAAVWLEAKEPVIVIRQGDEVQGYPLQILMWHELVNDTVAGVPILVSYCPLCNSAVVFDRRVGGRTYEFGVSGMLRDSDMVMYDRETDSLWQQITGEGIVGAMTGQQLKMIASQTIPFRLLMEQHPDAKILSRDTGYARAYGENPYVGYESTEQLMFPARRSSGVRLKERLVAIVRDGRAKAYPFELLRRSGVVGDEIGGDPYVIFFREGMRSALEDRVIAESRERGAATVFFPEVDGRRLTFQQRDGRIVDEEIGSTWNLLGVAVDGPLAGRQLTPVPHQVAFAFAWLVFQPDTEVVGSAQ